MQIDQKLCKQKEIRKYKLILKNDFALRAEVNKQTNKVEIRNKFRHRKQYLLRDIIIMRIDILEDNITYPFN